MERKEPLPKRRIGTASLLAYCFILASCTDSDSVSDSVATEVASTSSSRICETFRVYAQNRWQPYGTAVREEPNVLSDKVASFAPNEVIAVNGWYDSGEPVYPTNPEPWNSGVWLRVAFDNVEGYVSFAGVRGAPSSPDETGFSDYGGEPAELPADCELQQL